MLVLCALEWGSDTSFGIYTNGPEWLFYEVYIPNGAPVAQSGRAAVPKTALE